MRGMSDVKRVPANTPKNLLEEAMAVSEWPDSLVKLIGAWKTFRHWKRSERICLRIRPPSPSK